MDDTLGGILHATPPHVVNATATRTCGRRWACCVESWDGHPLWPDAVPVPTHDDWPLNVADHRAQAVNPTGIHWSPGWPQSLGDHVDADKSHCSMGVPHVQQRRQRIARASPEWGIREQR